MKQRLLILIVSLTFLILNSNYAQDKLAQSGMQFLSVASDARSSALAGASTALNNFANSVFSNPALLSDMTNTIDFSANYNLWIADIKYNSFAFAYNPYDGLYGTFGIGFTYVDYGKFEGTIIADNEQGFLETNDFSPNAFALGLTYSKALTDKFSVGGNVKFVYQNLGSFTIARVDSTGENIDVSSNMSVVAFDFGTIYKTGYKSLAFGISVQNFSKELRYVRENFQLPLTFNIGASMNILDFLPERLDGHEFWLSVDAIHPRSHPEQLKFGFEYKFINTLFIRGGYLTNDDNIKFTYGIGVKQFGFALDYSYTPFKYFQNVHRFSLRFSL